MFGQKKLEVTMDDQVGSKICNRNGHADDMVTTYLKFGLLLTS